MPAADSTAPEVILASASARRRALLEQAGFRVLVHPADIAEIPLPGEKPDAFVCRMAREKAAVIADRMPGHLVVAADTVIALGDDIIGKPRDRADAAAILTRLAGRDHRVLTGVCLKRRQPIFLHNWFVTSHVRFRPLTPAQIADYLDRANWQDKAGAYAIQEHGAELVESYSGLFSTIVGLPIEQVAERLRTTLG